MALSEEETIHLLQAGLSALSEFDEPIRRNILESNGWVKLLYSPTPELYMRIKAYFEWLSSRKKEIPGELMEEIAYLLFKSLNGTENIRSYQSYAAQHDLVVDGSSFAWQMLMKYLHLPDNGRTIVVECKNEKSKISDQQFSRLCGILQNKFTDTAQLGVFVSRQTATGFPENGAKKRSLSDARATQVIFHAKSKKFVIVVDQKDLENIARGFSFPMMLEAKIREVEASYGTEITFNEKWEETKLPAHLQKYS